MDVGRSAASRNAGRNPSSLACSRTMNARNLLAAMSAAALFTIPIPGCGPKTPAVVDPEMCVNRGLQPYGGGCVSQDVFNFMSCTQDRGINRNILQRSVDNKGGSIGANIPGIISAKVAVGAVVDTIREDKSTPSENECKIIRTCAKLVNVTDTDCNGKQNNEAATGAPKSTESFGGDYFAVMARSTIERKLANAQAGQGASAWPNDCLRIGTENETISVALYDAVNKRFAKTRLIALRDSQGLHLQDNNGEVGILKGDESNGYSGSLETDYFDLRKTSYKECVEGQKEDASAWPTKWNHDEE
jgi:hypothetical protein